MGRLRMAIDAFWLETQAVCELVFVRNTNVGCASHHSRVLILSFQHGSTGQVILWKQCPPSHDPAPPCRYNMLGLPGVLPGLESLMTCGVGVGWGGANKGRCRAFLSFTLWVCASARTCLCTCPRAPCAQYSKKCSPGTLQSL